MITLEEAKELQQLCGAYPAPGSAAGDRLAHLVAQVVRDTEARVLSEELESLCMELRTHEDPATIPPDLTARIREIAEQLAALS